MADELWALGLMSGTSLDGVDAALVRTDGIRVLEFGPFRTEPYDAAFRERLRAVLGGKGDVAGVERDLTEVHAAAVKALLREAGRKEADLIGFHGHTILHAPEARRTWQIGDGALLARQTGIDVVHDFRSADVAAGGEGAPLAPVYHAALAAALERPLAVLNIGGVANVTWIDGPPSAPNLIAFDTGPGNALVDDWVRRHDGRLYDADGALAAAGRVDMGALARLLDHDYFGRIPPKSLDRDAFSTAPVAKLSTPDGAATLTAFTAHAVARAVAHFPAPPRRWLVTGGGRHNRALMAALAQALPGTVAPVEAARWNGDGLEAQAFAYLAVRSLRGLPLSFPGTTGVERPMAGGVLRRA
ncbi:MAG: anhydro-N-acetylmuramic acid kinase [Alphaproteobacteria bacterium]